MTNLELKAPPGKFRVVGVDTFDGTDWIEDDCDDLETAKLLIKAKTRGEQMLKYHVYNDQGNHVAEEGTI